ncbi:kinesin-like protein [Haematococcus lacustris]
MVKQHVKVFVRTRPTAANYQGLKVEQDGASITVHVPKEADAGIINNQAESFAFKFDSVLENVTQEALYSSVASEVVDSVLAGFSGCIFAYGQTGAGKTFTMAGDIRNYVHRGVIPRAIHHIFHEADMRVDKIYKTKVSYLEIYNDQLYDLLAPTPGSSEGLAIMEDAVQGTFVRGLTLVDVSTEEEALAQYFVGEQGRSTAQHVLNAHSSRSHCVFTLHLEMRTSEAASERAVLSRLHLVDLAGSERTKKTNVSGQSMKEAQFINKSLSFLEQTVAALGRRDAHIPYRQSRLTNVLKDALGGNCKTVMVANIWGEPSHVEETLSTLRFASRVRTLTTDVSVSESNDPGLLLKRYERQVRELRQELAMRDALSGKARVNYDDLSEADLKDLQALANSFLQGEVDVEQLPCDSVKRIRECYKALRLMAQAAQAALHTQLREAASLTGAALMDRASTAPGTGLGDVGDVDRGKLGFQVGMAPPDARPVGGLQLGSLSGGGGGAAIPGAGPRSVENGSGGGGPHESHSATITVAGGPERNAAFSHYKHDIAEGRNLNTIAKDRAAQLRDVKAAIKDSTADVNASKSEIDRLTALLAERRPSGATRDGDIVDAEYLNLSQALKAAKLAYRTAFDKLKDLRGSLEALAASAAQAKQELITEFDNWVAMQGGNVAGLNLGGSGAEESELDAGEAFERMQLARLAANDPDSAVFHSALKKTAGVRASGAFGGMKR